MESMKAKGINLSTMIYTSQHLFNETLMSARNAGFRVNKNRIYTRLTTKQHMVLYPYNHYIFYELIPLSMTTSLVLTILWITKNSA